VKSLPLYYCPFVTKAPDPPNRYGTILSANKMCSENLVRTPSNSGKNSFLRPVWRGRKVSYVKQSPPCRGLGVGGHRPPEGRKWRPASEEQVSTKP